MKLTVPGTSIYQQFLASARALIKEGAASNAETGLGSTLYEWVVRPAAVVFGGLTEALESTFDKYGLEYLSTSTATDNPIADQVMSNYFITRNTGDVATAVVTILSTTGTEFIPQGTALLADSIELTVMYAYQAYTSTAEGSNTEDTRYVKSYKLPNGLYIYSVQCESVNNSDNVIAAGTAVSGLEYLDTVDTAYLESAISGGSVVETDAEMVLRAKSTVASPVGSSSTIDKLLRSFGIPILGTKSFGFGDPEMLRGSNNVLLTSTGGFVDTYVQTSNYLSTKSATVELVKTDNEYTAVLDEYFPTANWFYTVSSVESVDTSSVVSWKVEYSSKDNRYTPEAVRLSALQSSKLKVKLSGISTDTALVIVSVQYMPSIGALQAFSDASNDKPLGMSILVKAAPIAIIGVSGKATGVTTEAFIDIYKSFLKSRGVGSGPLKLSDLIEVLQTNVPGSQLVSPTVFTISYVTNTNELVNNYVTDGVVRPLEYTEYGWTSRTFCYCTADNMIKVVGDD